MKITPLNKINNLALNKINHSIKFQQSKYNAISFGANSDNDIDEFLDSTRQLLINEKQSILDRATKREKEIISQAQQKANGIILNARNNAQETLNKAKLDAQKIIQEAKNEVNKKAEVKKSAENKPETKASTSPIAAIENKDVKPTEGLNNFHIKISQEDREKYSQELQECENDPRIREIKDNLAKMGKSVETCTASELFTAIGIKNRTDKNGKVILEEFDYGFYHDKSFQYAKLGVDLNKLFKEVIEIEGDLALDHYSFKHEKLCGKTYALTSLGSLERCGSFYDFGSRLQDYGNLTRVEHDVYLPAYSPKTLGNIEYIGGNFIRSHSYSLENLGKLRYVGGNMDISYCENLADLGELEHVKGNLEANNTGITSLGKLKRVGGNAKFGMCKNLDSLGELEYVGEELVVTYTNVRNLQKLKEVKGNILIWHSPLTIGHFSKVKTGGKIYENWTSF